MYASGSNIEKTGHGLMTMKWCSKCSNHIYRIIVNEKENAKRRRGLKIKMHYYCY